MDDFEPVALKLETQAQVNMVVALLGGLTTPVMDQYKVNSYAILHMYDKLSGYADCLHPKLDIKVDEDYYEI